MSELIYEVVEHVGLPTGHLGPGMPPALYVGSRVKESRISDFISRLTNLGSIRVAQDQKGGEAILTAPDSDVLVASEDIQPDPTATEEPAKPKGKKNVIVPEDDLDLSDVQGVKNGA